MVTALSSSSGSRGRSHPLRAIAEALVDDRDALVDEVLQSILQNESAYASRQIVDESSLRAAVSANMTEIYLTLGGKALDFATFDEIGRLRAESDFPLYALLHAYRIGGRLEWDRFIREAIAAPRREKSVIEGTARFWEIWDVAVNRVTWSYEETAARRKRDEVGERDVMLDLLVNGHFETDDALWNAAHALQLPLTGQFLVTAAETRAFQPVLSNRASRFEAIRCASVWRTYEELEMGVISLARSTGLDEVVSLVDSLAQGPTGVSEPFNNLRSAHGAFREARIACDASKGNPIGATLYSEVPLQAIMVVTPGSAEQLRRNILGSLLELGDTERRDLIETIRGLADAGGSVSECARRMYLHRNSVYHRLERVHELTGRNPQTPIGMAELYAAIEADRILSHQMQQPKDHGG